MLFEFLQSILETVRELFRRDPTTRAASVEFWVMASTWLLLVKFAVGSMGPRFMVSSQYVNPGVQILRILSHYSVSYSLGLMQPSTSEQGSATNDLFQVWAVLIVTMQDSVSIGRPYKPQEMSTVDLLTSLWSANQLRAKTAMYLKVPLWIIWSIHASRIIWYYVSSDSAEGASTDNMKLVGDYMASSSSQHADHDACPKTMVGYRYLVLGEDEQVKKIERPSFRFQLDHTRPEELITLDKVWSHHDSGDRLLSKDADGRFKDVCLSFALYKLLRRRFFDFPIPEADHPAMRRLISQIILDDNHERVFRVTEVELSFLQDLSYSKHAVVFAAGFPTQRLMLSLLMTSAASYLAYAVHDLPRETTAVTAGGRLAKITHGVLVTRWIILIMVCREMWEIGVYVLSQWTKVLIVCNYIRQKQRPTGWVPMLQRWMTEKAARIMFWLVWRGQWDEKIQQYNLLIGAQVKTTPNRRLRSRSVKLGSNIKKVIFESLNQALSALAEDGKTNDSSSASVAQKKRNKLLMSHHWKAFAEKRSLQSKISTIYHALKAGDTHKVLVWHVATSLCQIKLLLLLLGEEATGCPGDLYMLNLPSTLLRGLEAHYATVVSLSNYCAYLVTEALVPDNGLVADKVFDAVREGANYDLRGCRTLGEVHNTLVAAAWVPDEQNGPSIIKIGTKLSMELMSTYGAVDKEDLWESLGKFWAGFLLHLSASTIAAKHRIHLQGRGELTTHLWALLSHAGFLGADTDHGQQLLDPVDLNAA